MPATEDFQSSPWWEESGQDKAAKRAQKLFRHFVDQDKNRLAAYNAYSQVYTNRDVLSGKYMSQYAAAFSVASTEYSRLPLNLAKVMVDAVFARLTRPAIAVEFLPTGGNPSLRKRSKLMTQFADFMFHKHDVRRKSACAERDALIYGLGTLKTSAHPKAPMVVNDRIHPRDMFVDPVEATASGEVTQIYQRQFVSRGTLLKMFPERKKAILDAGRITDQASSNTDWAQNNTQLSGLVEVVEGWKKESWPGAGNGKHIIFIDKSVLWYDDFEGDFPFSFVRWKDDPTLGFFGISLVEELLGMHCDINTSLLQANLTVEAMPKPIFFVPADGEVNEGSIGNVHGIIIKHTGRAPTITMPNSVPTDIVNLALQQWQWALQISGLVALGLPEKAGNQAETGQAFQDLVDIQSTELAPAFQQRSDFLVRVAEQQINAGRAVNTRLKETDGKSFRVVLRKNRNTVMGIDWNEIDMDPKDDSYVIQAQPTSALSQTFGARLGQVKELISIGLIPLSRAFKLLDIPDLDSEMNLQNASQDLVERIMEEILDEGKYTSPEPTMDLALAFKTAQRYINFGQTMEVSEDTLNMLDDFIRETDDLIKQEQEATRMQAAGLGPGFAGSPPALDINGGAVAASPVPGAQ